MSFFKIYTTYEQYSNNDFYFENLNSHVSTNSGTGPTGPMGATGYSGDVGPTGPTGSFSFEGTVGEILFYNGTDITGSTGFTYIPGGTGMHLDGNLNPTIANTFSLGTPDVPWKELSVGPGTISLVTTVAGVVASLGVDLNNIVYSTNGFATPYINVGPQISAETGAIGGWQLSATGTPGINYDLVAQEIIPDLKELIHL